MMPDQRNLLLAIVLSVSIIVIFQWVYETPRQKQLEEQAEAQQQAEEIALPRPEAPGAAPDAPAATGGVAEIEDRAQSLSRSARVAIRSARLSGSISLAGGRIDDMTLLGYSETLEADSPEIVLLWPRGLDRAYYAEFGWRAAGSDAVALPDADTVWRANRKTLTPNQPVKLSWDNGADLTFERIFELDQDYMITVTQRVRSRGAAPVTLYPFGLVSRSGTPETLGYFILHEGPLGVFDGTLAEPDYDDLVDEGTIKQRTTGGWIGITDKYWLVALVPDQSTAVNTRFVHFLVDRQDRYQVDYLGASGMALATGASIEVRNRLFVGAKQAKLLDRYTEDLGIARFDLAIDWGWFYWFTRPIFYVLDYLHGVLGNFGLAILLLTVMIKLVFFPLANKSYKAMSSMKKLQPQMKELRDLYGDDKTRLNEEMMALYKREKLNPAAGCLPIVIQIPVFFALYKVLFVTIEMRHAPFYGWVHDLSARDPTNLFNLFGLIPWTPPEILAVGLWPLIMGLSMYLQQKLNPQPADPMQAKLFLMLPLLFTFLLARFPAGLVIYWAWNNTLSIAQQYVIMRRAGVPIGGGAGTKSSGAGTKSSGAGTKGSGAGTKGSGAAKKSSGVGKKT